MAELKIRKAVPSDYIFIMDSWMRSYRKSPDSNLPDNFFFPAYRAIAATLLRTAICEILCPPDNEDVILGYIVYSDNACHWIYIKNEHREQGCAKLLMERVKKPTFLTMTTPLGRKRLRYPIKQKMLRNKMNIELGDKEVGKNA